MRSRTKQTFALFRCLSLTLLTIACSTSSPTKPTAPTNTLAAKAESTVGQGSGGVSGTYGRVGYVGGGGGGCVGDDEPCDSWGAFYLRAANGDELSGGCYLELEGNSLIRAGMCQDLKGSGRFEGATGGNLFAADRDGRQLPPPQPFVTWFEFVPAPGESMRFLGLFFAPALGPAAVLLKGDFSTSAQVVTQPSAQCALGHVEVRLSGQIQGLGRTAGRVTYCRH